MIALSDIRYVRMGTRDLDATTRYATAILGLECGPRERGVQYMRSDTRDHTLAYFAGDPRDHTVAFDVRDGQALDAAAAQIDAYGLPVRWGTRAECDERHVEQFLHFKDPSGNAIELVVGAGEGGQPYRASREAGI